MHTNRYWALQEVALKQAGITDRNDCERDTEIVDVLQAALAQLSEADLKATFADYCQLLIRAYTKDIRAAAFLAPCHDSDEGFSNFREWLILQGPTYYEKIVANPDSLADTLEDDEDCFTEFFGLMSAFCEAVERKGMDQDTCFEGLLPMYPELDMSWRQDKAQLATLLPRLYTLENNDTPPQQEMALDTYWGLLEVVRAQAGIGDCRTIGLNTLTVEATLYAVLEKLSEVSAAEASEHTDALMREANTPGLLAAAAIISGPLTVEGFDYFREWLILQGKQVYTLAVANPDSLADYLRDINPGMVHAQFEGLRATFHKLAEEQSYNVDNFCTDINDMESEEECWEDAETAQKLPKLVALFGRT